jgi:hypothetical protein
MRYIEMYVSIKVGQEQAETIVSVEQKGRSEEFQEAVVLEWLSV